MSMGAQSYVNIMSSLVDQDPIERRMHCLDAGGRRQLIEAQRELSQSLEAAGLNFEGHAYPVSLRPLAISANQAMTLADMAERFVKLLDTVAALYLEDSRVRGMFPHYDEVSRYITELPWYRPLARICRLDMMLDSNGQFRIVETNAECPGGVIQSAVATRIWRQMCNPLIEGLRIEDTAQPFVANPDFFCHALIDTHWAGASRRPERAAVINFKGRFTNEVEHIVGALNRLGVATSAIDAAKLRCTPDGVGDESGERLDLVYGKFDPRDLLGEPMVADFLMAAAGGQTTCVNPLVSQFVLADKIVLAVLSDEQFSSNFSSAERALVRMHVPWTRIVRRGVTSDPEGRRADLLDYITANKDRLVLKPSNATRGEGAVVGSFTDRKTWERHLARAASSTPYVVQEYLRGTTITATNPASETFDTMTAGLDVYVFNGWFAGFHARASLDPVINIGKRGMLLPVAVIAEGRLS